MRSDIVNYDVSYHCKILTRELVLGSEESAVLVKSRLSSCSKIVRGLLVNLAGNYLGDRREVVVETK